MRWTEELQKAVSRGHIIQNADEGTDSEMAPEVDAYLSKWGL